MHINEGFPRTVEQDIFVRSDLRLTWVSSIAMKYSKLPGSFSRPCSGTLLNLTWLRGKAPQTFSGTVFGIFSETL